MKQLFTLFTLSLVVLTNVHAQNWVDTTAQNKKVVLEEFTGIHCTYCPDGHKRANALAAANEGDVFLINVHTGSYARPSTGELDMRTTEGDVIAGSAGITGYPAGSVNRIKTPWAESRANWSNTASSVMSQQSPVNTYVKAYFDRDTRELTTEVEVYYTADVTGDHQLTVVLTQDNILGTQTGGTTYYPENFINGQYIHNHVLRQVLSTGGAWGETLSTPAKGDYIYRKYVTTLPEDIKSIPLVFYDLNVVAFISKGDHSNIMTAHGAEVEYDHSGIVDLTLKDVTSMPSTMCMDPFTPSVEVTNASQDTVHTFRIRLEANGQTYNKDFDGTLLPNAKTTILFDNSIQPEGEYSFSYARVGDINGGVLEDVTSTNDQLEVSGIGMNPDAFTYAKFGFNGSMDANTARIMDQNEKFGPVTQGGFGGGAIRYSIHSSWGVAGKPAKIVVGEADFTSITDPQLTYHYAYSDGGQGGSAPSIRVEVSDDCGANFSTVNTITCTSTGEPSNPQYYYVPATSEYIQETIDLSAYAGKSILVMVSGIPGTSGNALYIDEIELGSASKMAAVTELELVGLQVFPNPASDQLNIELKSGRNATAELLDMQGKLLMRADILNGKVQLSMDSFANGMYLLKVHAAEGSATRKVTIAH